MLRVAERRVGPLYLSAPEVSGQQLELCEIGQNDASSLNHQFKNTQTIKRKHPEYTTHTDEKRFKSEISKEDFVAPPS
uniref:Uncharacterized protein n=1 Tax=Loa loa TaxID=7209 RepID=A0A1I7VBM6_LOALO